MATITIQMFTILFIISSYFIQIINSHKAPAQPEGMVPKVTNLRFYFNDKVSGRNPTAVPIVPPNGKLPFSFGGLVMIDDLLTVGPEVSSGIMGRAQGFYGFASLENWELLMVMNYVFNERSGYMGSTLSLLGRNAVTDAIREMPIIGGTGAFQLARGFAQAKTYRLDTTTGDAIVEYNVTVYHFE